MGFEYSGDVTLEHGGAFFDLSTWDDGYVTAVRVTDLDSGCGFRGACLIEHVVINGTDRPDRIRRALESCYGGAGSLGARNWRRTGRRETVKANLRHAIADALMSYGFTDPDDYAQPCQSETVQLEPDGPMTFGGWRADKRLHNTDLRAYVESVHLRG